MRIGLVYELPDEFAADGGRAALPDASAESASDDEIETLVETLEGLGHAVERIGNIERLTRFIVNGGAVDLFFNYAAGLRGAAREAQIPALLEAYGLPYTGADPTSLALCLDKTITKRLWRDHGLPTADFVHVDSLVKFDRHLNAVPEYPLFVKPAREGSSKGISPENVVRSPAELRQRVEHLLKRYQQPVLIEEYLPGREYSVGVLGSGLGARVLGAAEVASPGVLGLKEKKAFGEHSFLPVEDEALRDELINVGRKAYLAVECQVIGRVDLKLDRADRPHLLEINPNPGLHPVRSILPAIARRRGWTYRDLIGEVLRLALERWGAMSEAARIQAS
jgi:D-alanine-D-alanine ligase